MLNHYQVASDVLAVIMDCLEQPTCVYSSFVSLGKPPQDCNYIAAHWLNDVVESQMSPCHIVFRHTFEITINRCCFTEDVEFDPVAQDENARCFLQDFDAIFCCLQQHVGEVLPGALNCEDPFVEQSIGDREIEGQCYSSTIRFGFSKLSCCN